MDVLLSVSFDEIYIRQPPKLDFYIYLLFFIWSMIPRTLEYRLHNNQYVFEDSPPYKEEA